MRHVENWLALDPFLDSHHIERDRGRTHRTLVSLVRFVRSPHKTYDSTR